jgi:hypothetical protein
VAVLLLFNPSLIAHRKRNIIETKMKGEEEEDRGLPVIEGVRERIQVEID